MALGESSLDSSSVIATTMALRMRNTTPILFRKGKLGINIFIPRESGMVRTAAQSAELAVAFFQKSPKMNMANIPGLIKPVNSWINWKATMR